MSAQASVIRWNITQLENDKEKYLAVGRPERTENDTASDDDQPASIIIIPMDEGCQINPQDSPNTVYLNVRIQVDSSKTNAGTKCKSLRQNERSDDEETCNIDEGSSPNSQKTYKCSMCSKSFFTRGHLARHTNLHTMDTLYPCTECGKVLLDKSYLLRHMKMHDVPKYECKSCEKRFSTPSSLKRHETTHDLSLRPHVCTECEKRFPDMSSLKKHIRTHTGEKTHICTICAKGFSHRGDLNIHIKSHDNVKQYHCDVCGRGFTRNNNLMRHKVVHSENGDYECEICKVIFQHAATLTRHMLSCHPGEVRVKKKEKKVHLGRNEDPEKRNYSERHSGESNTEEPEEPTYPSVIVFNKLNEEQSQDNDSKTPQQIELVRSSPSSFEIYHLDASGTLLRV